MSIFGHDVEFVHEASHAGQTQPQTARSGKAVLHGLANVADARSLIAGDDIHATLIAFFNEFEEDFAALRVADDITRQLRDRRSDDRQFGR